MGIADTAYQRIQVAVKSGMSPKTAIQEFAKDEGLKFSTANWRYYEGRRKAFDRLAKARQKKAEKQLVETMNGNGHATDTAVYPYPDYSDFGDDFEQHPKPDFGDDFGQHEPTPPVKLSHSIRKLIMELEELLSFVEMGEHVVSTGLPGLLR